MKLRIGPLWLLPLLLPLTTATAYAQVLPPSVSLAASTGGSAPSGAISATATAMLPATSVTGASQNSLSVQVTGKGATPSAALTAMKSNAAAVEQALVGAGIPKSSIQIGYFNSNPVYTPLKQGQSGPPSVSGYTVNENLQADAPSQSAMEAALQAAINAGASGANGNTGVFGPFGSPPPTAALAAAVGQAAAQAKAEDQAIANALGVTLGPLQSVSTSAPNNLGYGPKAAYQVQVTVAFRIGS